MFFLLREDRIFLFLFHFFFHFFFFFFTINLGDLVLNFFSLLSFFLFYLFSSLLFSSLLFSFFFFFFFSSFIFSLFWFLSLSLFSLFLTSSSFLRLNRRARSRLLPPPASFLTPRIRPSLTRFPLSSAGSPTSSPSPSPPRVCCLQPPPLLPIWSCSPFSF